MSTSTKKFFATSAALVVATLVASAQDAAPPHSVPGKAIANTKAALGADTERNSDLAPMTMVQAAPATAAAASPTPATSPVTGIPSTTTTVAAAAATPASATAATASTPATETASSSDNGGVGVREFQGDDVGQVLRLLARQAKINMVVSEAVTGTVTMRLEDVTALQAIGIIVKAKSLFMAQIDNVYYIKTDAERTAEPTESDSYQFSYGRATDIAPLLASQLSSKSPPQVDERTNTIFFRETRSNIDNIRRMLAQIDKPTKQVMIEARLVEVSANPKQSYGVNWAGVVGSASAPQKIGYSGTNGKTDAATGQLIPDNFTLGNLVNNNILGNLSHLVTPQFAILTVPQMSLTVQALNEDSDAEFLANPRVVTADNKPATIEITTNQPVPQLNFNEQTATAVFGGFQDKTFGNKLEVTPSVNKDNFVTLSVKPEISNKVSDFHFQFQGADVFSPIIDKRTLNSNVLIRSGDTLAIGGLLQDQTTKTRTKVPLMGDIPMLGYLFQSHGNERTKRNLLVFVTPTILEQHYGTGLEDQIGGLHDSGGEFADPNGWRNNAKGAVRLVPTSNRQLAAEYPKPGTAPAPAQMRYMSTAKDRDE